MNWADGTNHGFFLAVNYNSNFGMLIIFEQKKLFSKTSSLINTVIPRVCGLCKEDVFMLCHLVANKLASY